MNFVVKVADQFGSSLRQTLRSVQSNKADLPQEMLLVSASFDSRQINADR